MYIEDFGKSRPLSADEAKALSVKVQCAVLPGRTEYETHLAAAGFPEVSMSDVTSAWKDFTASRLAMFRAARASSIAVHGQEIVDDLDDFYGAVAQLFQDDAIAGLKIIAR